MRKARRPGRILGRGFSLLLLLRRALDAGDGRSGLASLKAKPRIAPGPLLSKIHPLDKEFQYLLPLFGAAMLSAPEPALS
jgi:hypothetical protein